MSTVSAPADRRFRRALVKPMRKRALWTRIVRPLLRSAAITAVVLYGGYRGSLVAARAHVLQVERIVVHGNERLSEGDVLAVLTGLRGESLIWTNLEAWRRRLLSSPWIREAVLRRSLPSTVDIVVSERQPIGLARIDGAMYLVDEHGVIIDQFGRQYADLDLPIIDGLQGRAGREGGGACSKCEGRVGAVGALMSGDPRALINSGEADPNVDEMRAELAARLIADVTPKPEIARRVSQIDVTDLHNAAVILAGDPAIVRLGDDRFLPRLESYLELASALRERVPDLDSVDLRFDDRIYVRPVAGYKPAAGRSSNGDPLAVRGHDVKTKRKTR
jgi:cell division septal protein FtsQ